MAAKAEEEKMNTEAAAAPQMTVSAGIQVLLFVVVAIAIWIVLTMVLKIHAGFAGYLILWYWTTVERADFARLPFVVVGGLVGVALAWQLSFLVAHYGMAGLAVALIVIMAAVFVQIMQTGGLFINNSTMMFLTVLTAPQMAGVHVTDAIAAVALGTVYFGAIVYGAQAYVARRTRPKLHAA
jgi:hypothetical protein